MANAVGDNLFFNNLSTEAVHVAAMTNCCNQKPYTLQQWPAAATRTRSRCSNGPLLQPETRSRCSNGPLLQPELVTRQVGVISWIYHPLGVISSGEEAPWLQDNRYRQ